MELVTGKWYENEILYADMVETKWGSWYVEASDRGLRKIQLLKKGDDMGLDYIIKNEWTREAIKQLLAYFEGGLKNFELQLDLRGGSGFCVEVWKHLLKIEYGRTTTYLKLANMIGDPKSVRAVGMANRVNPIAVVVPCHRCIASDGKMQGYFYGKNMKRKLLAHESPEVYGEQLGLEFG